MDCFFHIVIINDTKLPLRLVVLLLLVLPCVGIQYLHDIALDSVTCVFLCNRNGNHVPGAHDLSSCILDLSLFIPRQIQRSKL